MTLVTLQDALQHAEGSGYAIGAFNFTNEEMLLGIVDAAVAEHSPVIIAIAEAHLPSMRWKTFMKMVTALAAEAPTPVVIHLDHATRFETIYQAFQLGFTSVMYDGSILSFDENVRNTCNIVQIAHTLGISVEAELGHIGGNTDEVGVPHNDRAKLTDPSLTPEFVRQTNVDALAVSFGTAHGFYARAPELDFSLLEKINQQVDTPLVLHGGTGLTDDAFRMAIDRGIRKINYGTDLFAVSSQAARSVLTVNQAMINYSEVSLAVRKAVQQRVRYYLQLWNSAQQSWN